MKTIHYHGMSSTDESTGVLFTPFIDHSGAVGYKCEHPDGRIEHLYFNPSLDSDDGQANVFIYHEREAIEYSGAFMHINVFDDRED